MSLNIGHVFHAWANSFSNPPRKPSTDHAKPKSGAPTRPLWDSKFRGLLSIKNLKTHFNLVHQFTNNKLRVVYRGMRSERNAYYTCNFTINCKAGTRCNVCSDGLNISLHCFAAFWIYAYRQSLSVNRLGQLRSDVMVSMSNSLPMRVCIYSPWQNWLFGWVVHSKTSHREVLNSHREVLKLVHTKVIAII